MLSLDSDWHFEGKALDGSTISLDVDLPHTWNSSDAQMGLNYYRGIGKYTRKLPPDAVQEGKRLFVRFEGANTVTDVEVNGKPAGRHRGGYSAFAFEITSLVRSGTDNLLTVKVDNSFHEDIMPLSGDFNIHGGLYRPAQLIITDAVCISPLDYASPGVYLRQINVTRESAELEVITVLSSGPARPGKVSVGLTIADAEGNTVIEQADEHQFEAAGTTRVSQPVTIPKPHLWSGREDPYLYQVSVRLKSGEQVLDEVRQPLGLRYFQMDPKEGFLLNGKRLKLQGVSRHQDWKDKGSALLNADHDRDLALILELGANAVRLAHYQHSEYFYSLCDRAGLVAWAEIPFVGSLGSGYNDTSAFRENGKQQLIELIRQNFNHPSIVFWGLFNELSEGNGSRNPESFVHELHVLAKKEDPERLTTAATFLDGDKRLNAITDIIAFNRYFGWYYDKPGALARWADETRDQIRQRAFGISEYGAGSSITQHEQYPRRPFPMFHPWHPEEYQNIVHEISWPEIEKRPFIWGSFVWNMFDFGSSFRREGAVDALNDKGLVTYDRTVKKDAFYFYKANWSAEPVLHITSRRHLIRNQAGTDIKVYANMDEVELFLNAEPRGKATAAGRVFLWPGLALRKGNNIITVVGKRGGQEFRDSCVWAYDAIPWVNLLVPLFRWWVKPVYLLSFALAGILYLLVYRRDMRRWPRRICKILFYLTLAWLGLLIALYLAGWYYGVGVFDYSQF